MDPQENLKIYKDFNVNLKGDLDNQYQKWEEKIENRDVDDRDITTARIARYYFGNIIKYNQDNLEHEILKTSDEKVKQELTLLIKELDQFITQLVENNFGFYNFVKEVIEQQGLTSQRIQQFEQFTADESFVGDQCVICMGDIEIGRNMMRLDCDGQHTFCQACIEGLFANHKTCPICRYNF